jgi:ATP-dependent Clp protease ATP-binding subunit ClpA
MAAGSIGFGDSTADPKNAKKAIERVFTPEFRNRLDAIVFFDALPVEVIRMVARKFLDQLDGQLAEKGVHLEVSPAALDWFVEHGYDKAMGARPMARLVQTTLKAPLANEILFGKLVHGGIAHIGVKDSAIDISCEGAPAPELEDDEPPPKRPPPPPPRKAREPVN